MRTIPCIALLLLPASPMHGMDKTEADSLCAKGQRAYAADDYAAAVDAFNAVTPFFSSAALQLDLGNSWFKQGDLARAILHYERGLLLSPSDADLRANLALANEQVKDRLSDDGALTFGSTWAGFRGGSHPDQWARRSLFASFILFALLGLAVALRKRSLARAAWILSGLACSILLVCILFASSRHRELVAHDHAIIMAPKVDARSEPRESGKVLFVLHKGSKVAVVKAENGWNEVRLPNGTVGWMPPGSLETI